MPTATVATVTMMTSTYGATVLCSQSERGRCKYNPSMAALYRTSVPALPIHHPVDIGSKPAGTSRK